MQTESVNELIRKRIDEFVQENKIYCSDTIYQSDRVIENAYTFLDDIITLSGFYQDAD